MSLTDLSNALAEAAEVAGGSVVRLGRRGRDVSGTVLSAEGHVIAIDHTVEGDEVELGLPDGGTTKARVVGRDPGTDLTPAGLRGAKRIDTTTGFSPFTRRAVGPRPRDPRARLPSGSGGPSRGPGTMRAHPRTARARPGFASDRGCSRCPHTPRRLTRRSRRSYRCRRPRRRPSERSLRSPGAARGADPQARPQRAGSLPRLRAALPGVRHHTIGTITTSRPRRGK